MKDLAHAPPEGPGTGRKGAEVQAGEAGGTREPPSGSGSRVQEPGQEEGGVGGLQGRQAP